MLRRVVKGEPLRARDWNELVELSRGTRFAAPARGRTGGAGGGTLLGLAGLLGRLGNRITFARNIEIHGGVQGTPAVPSGLTYRLAFIDGGKELDNVAPTWGRPVVNDEVKVYPCPVGTWCPVLRLPDGEGGLQVMVYIEEIVARGPCPGGKPAAPPPGGEQRRQETVAGRQITIQGGAGSPGGGGGGAPSS